MAGHGPAPKDPDERVRRNGDAEATTIEADGALHGPDLPDDSFDWPDATQAWWSTWRKSAQASTFTDTDWSFLLDTAVLHMEFWDGNRRLAAELRLRVAKFGATLEDRARLKMAVGDPKPAEVREPRAPQKARRTRVLQVVADADSA